MPIVNTNIIKEWFRTLKKPTEDQFHAWLDSFRHKWEKVPMNDVEGLPKALRDKADLVNGIVPEEQLPFSIKTSEVLAIGAITASENSVSVGLHASGKNRVRLAGVIYERSFANNFMFAPVVNYYKILIVYALPEPGLFFLAEGAEALEAIEPELPEAAFVIRRIVVSTTGQIIEPETATGLKYAEEDGWRNINLTEVVTILPYSYDLRSSYYITGSVEGATIGGIRNALIDRNASPSWNGKEFWIYNATGGDLLLDSAAVTDDDVFLLVRPITLKSEQSCKVKLRRDALEIVGLMSGGAEFPPGNPGDVLVKGAEEWEASSRLTNVEAATDMLLDELSEEIADRAAADNLLQFQIDAEEGRNNTQDAQIADLAVHSIAITTTTDITTNTIDAGGRSQNGREVAIKNGVNAINLTCELNSPANFLASYTKEGSAGITVLAGVGATLYQTDGTNVINGIKGSTFCIKRSGNEFQLQISNR